MKWAHEHGCPWDKYTCYAAAKYGYLDILIYAREHGCDWDRASCEITALVYSHEHILEWMNNN
jgi:hypothetical protein